MSSRCRLPAVLAGVVLLSGAASAAEPDGLLYPRIKGFGGVVAVCDGAEPPRPKTRILFDITADSKPDAVNKGLERVARCLNLYAAAGVKDSDVTVAVVLHGDAARCVLNDAGYAESVKGVASANPNLPLVRELKKAGVELFVCGQSLHYKKLKAADVSPEFRVAVAAMIVVANRQADGFAVLAIP